MTNNVVGSLLGNMLGTVLIQGLRGQGMTAMGGDGGNMGGDMSRDELARLEEMAKMSMASEMFDLMRAYNKYKVTHFIKFEPRHEKTYFSHMRTASAQSDQHLCCSLPR